MTDTSTSTTGTWSMNLQLGSMWFDLSVGDEPDLDHLAAQVDDRIEREPRLAVSRQELIDMLVYFSRDAVQQGAARGGLRWTVEELDGVAAATLYTTVFQNDEVHPVDDSIHALYLRLAGRHKTDTGEPNVEVRELPAGKAVRVQVISDNFPDTDESDQERGVLLETVQYWVPVPEHPVVLLFTFSTPNLAAAEPLVAEFDFMLENKLRITP